MDFSEELVKLFQSDDGKLFVPPKKKAVVSSDDRLIASFQQITDFVEKNSRPPELESNDMSEATLAARLNSIRSSKKKSDDLKNIDTLGLLEMPEAPESIDELFTKDTFGLFEGVGDDILKIKNLPNRRQVVHEVDEKAKRIPAQDFAEYKPLFEKTQNALREGSKKLTPFTSVDQIKVGGLYVNGGQMVYVAAEGEIEQKAGGYKQQRLRVIIENGTESNMYRRSLAQRLYEGGLAVVDRDYTGELALDVDDNIVGYIYVLRSLNDAENITSIKDLHKIGFTITTIADRIKNAEKDPTYLMAGVEVVDSYVITGDYNPQKVEHFIHRIFADAKVDLKIIDNEGREYTPSEWYSVPLLAIEQAVNMLQNGDIVDYHYDKNLQQIVANKG